MIEIVCEFVVKEEARGQFELAYGPDGAKLEKHGEGTAEQLAEAAPR